MATAFESVFGVDAVQTAIDANLTGANLEMVRKGNTIIFVTY